MPLRVPLSLFGSAGSLSEVLIFVEPEALKTATPLRVDGNSRLPVAVA